MAEEADNPPTAASPPLPPSTSSQQNDGSQQLQSPPKFDPSRMIGIIRRKALIRDLAAVYHSECLAYCQELLQLQKQCQEARLDIKAYEDLPLDYMRPAKRSKKGR